MKMQSAMQEFWKDHHKVTSAIGAFTYAMCEKVTCCDGFTMSVQASSSHYCTPREYLNNGNYEAMEVGFPSEPEDLLMEYAEDADRPTGTVYGYVPVSVIDAVIAKHGGVKHV